MRVNKLEHKVKSRKPRRRAIVVISDTEEDLEDPSKQGRRIAEIDQNPSISLVQDEGNLWIQEDVEIQGKTSVDTEILLDQEKATELVEDLGSGEKGEKEISTANISVSTASATPEVSTAAENLVYISRSAEKRKDKGKAIMKEDESVQKKAKEEVVAKTTQAYDIDWSDPAVLRYHAQQNRSFSKLKKRSIRRRAKETVSDSSSRRKVYQVFEDMLKRFDKDDLEKLWDLVKKKFSSTEPTIDKEKVLWVELKRLFEPNDDDTLWKLQRYMHDPLKWKLYDICCVHHVSTERGHDIFMLVEKDYPLTRALITVMLANKLQVDESSDMANELLRKIFY
ncbi:hypothetical protein Tco_0877246 [Tanacetum coccineum]|uniref:Uncharacterized protein n=1 Tax=Tanacetum coccineum TaxID=301880 RepID=A0ABQ5BUK0_9ASTR